MKRTYKAIILPVERIYTIGQLNTRVNEQRKLFCQEYIRNGWNGTKAYQFAYGYERSDNTAAVQATKLLRIAKIQQYIEYIKVDYEKLCGVSKAKQIKEYAKIAYSSIADMHETWMELKDFDALTREQKAAIQGTETKTILTDKGSEITQVKITLHSKTIALEGINKLMGYNEPEKQIVTTDAPVSIDSLTIEEKRTLLKLVRKNENKD